MGLSLRVAPEHRLPQLTAVRVPAGVDDAAVRRALLDGHDVEIGGGLGPLKGQVWRIGLMGYNARRESVTRMLTALEAVLGEADAPVSTGRALPASEAVWQAER